MNKPLIAVIIPSFNRAHCLGRAIKSVLHQTFTNFECLVVDDGSEDNTDAVVKSFKDPRLNMIRTHNQGVSKARNTGIEATCTKWLAFLDSDDAWRPQKLEKQMAALAQNPDHVLCHTNEVWIRNGKRVNPCKHHLKSGGFIFEQCLARCMISPSATVIKRSTLAELGLFDEHLPACEDYDLWLRVTAHYPVLYLEEALTVKYGGHEDQLSQKYPVMDRYRIHALEKLLDNNALSNAHRILVLKTIAMKSKIISDGAHKRGKLKLAKTFREKYLRARDKSGAGFSSGLCQN